MQRCTALRTLSHDRRTLPSEMIRPCVLAWIEEPSKIARLGIDGGDVGTLVSVAGQTGKRQIIDTGIAAVLPCNDMVRLVPMC